MWNTAQTNKKSENQDKKHIENLVQGKAWLGFCLESLLKMRGAKTKLFSLNIGWAISKKKKKNEGKKSDFQ